MTEEYLFSQWSDFPDPPEPFDYESLSLNDAQQLPPGARGPNFYSEQCEESESETSSDYPEPVTSTDSKLEAIHLTDMASVREVLSTLSNRNSGQIGQHLKTHKGLLILPLHAVSLLRMPTGRHTGNYPLLIYYPEKPLEEYPSLANLNAAINVLYFD